MSNFCLPGSSFSFTSLFIYFLFYFFAVGGGECWWGFFVAVFCTTPLSVNHILLKWPVTTELFLKDDIDFNVYNTVTYFLYYLCYELLLLNSVHSPVGKLI